MKKLLCYLLVLTMACSLGGALAEGMESGGVPMTISPDGYPVMGEQVDLSMLLYTTAPEGKGAWSTPADVVFFKNMEQKTNIHFSFENLVWEAWKERVQLLIAGDTLPDVFLKTRFSDADLVKYGGEGIIQDLTPYLEKYAPDFYQYAKEHDLLKYLTMNGGIWGLPYIYDSQGIRLGKIFFNTDWLAKVEKKMPTNWDEIFDVLAAFRDQDANDNGDPNDEIPCGFSDRGDLVSALSGEFGLMNRGTSMGAAYLDADPADETGNTLRFFYAADEMKDLLKMAKRFYDEKLIPSNFFDADYGDVYWQNAPYNKVGMHMLWATATDQYVDKYIAMDRAPSDLWTVCSGYLGAKGGLVLTKECKYPEAMVAWGNYMFTTKGAYDYFLGVEGETYTIQEDGTTALTDWVLKNPDGLTTEQAMLRYSVYSGGANPGLLTDNTFKGGETYWTSLEGNAKFAPYAPKVIWERFPLSAETTESVSTTRGDLDAVIAEYCANFITGKMDIDGTWDEFVSKLKQAGMEDYVWAYQEAYNKINGLS